jgi:hypothetical protein
VNYLDPTGEIIFVPLVIGSVALTSQQAVTIIGLTALTAYLYTPGSQQLLRDIINGVITMAQAARKSVEDVIKEIEGEAREKLETSRCETREPWKGPGEKWDPNKPPSGPWWKKVVWALGQIAQLIKGWPH